MKITLLYTAVALSGLAFNVSSQEALTEFKSGDVATAEAFNKNFSIIDQKASQNKGAIKTLSDDVRFGLLNIPSIEQSVLGNKQMINSNRELIDALDTRVSRIAAGGNDNGGVAPSDNQLNNCDIKFELLTYSPKSAQLGDVVTIGNSRYVYVKKPILDIVTGLGYHISYLEKLSGNDAGSFSMNSLNFSRAPGQINQFSPFNYCRNFDLPGGFKIALDASSQYSYFTDSSGEKVKVTRRVSRIVSIVVPDSPSPVLTQIGLNESFVSEINIVQGTYDLTQIIDVNDLTVSGDLLIDELDEYIDYIVITQVN